MATPRGGGGGVPFLYPQTGSRQDDGIFIPKDLLTSEEGTENNILKGGFHLDLRDKNYEERGGVFRLKLYRLGAGPCATA